ncbi:MAG TPA: hemerythrin domain-containing protein [Burkholderiales bacterium]|jgi:hemerythrin|nr:hemerythrin domain-containing protein [Burkholderiales bacterium]
MSAPNSLAWKDDYLLGYGPMDDTHREFVALVDAMLGCEDRDFLARLEAFERHAVAHFAEEDSWMKSTDFPPKDCHIDEHAAVLRSVHQVLALVRQEGDVAEGRRLAAALADWFPGHAFHLDSALSHWMVKRSHGGKPVVLRRNVIAKAT